MIFQWSFIIIIISAGLFQGAILQSGTALAPWGRRDDHKKIADEVAGMLKCPKSHTSEEILECLQQVDYKLLVGVNKYYDVSYSYKYCSWVMGQKLWSRSLKHLRLGSRAISINEYHLGYLWGKYILTNVTSLLLGNDNVSIKYS